MKAAAKTGAWQSAVETLECLAALGGEDTAPAKVQQALRRVGRRHPQHRIDLLWERAGPDGGWRYDALVRLPDQRTLSLSVHRDAGRPLPLLGARRWSDGDLLRVNTTVLRVDQAVEKIDRFLDRPELSQRLVDTCLLQAVLEQEPVEVDHEALQSAMDAFRRSHRLYSAAGARAWLAERRLTQVELEALVAVQAAVAGLRQRVVAGRVQACFEADPARFDTAYLAQLRAPNLDVAQATAAALRRDEVDFFLAAQASFLEAAGRGAGNEPVFRALQRGAGAPAWVQALFAAQPGALIGPFEDDQGATVVRLLGIRQARLDATVRAAIEQQLFDEWLQGLRDAADIEWYRGDAC